MKKKHIIITGASRGIGKAIALEFAGKETNLSLCCKNSIDKLEQVKQEVTAAGSGCFLYHGNMGIFSQAQSFIDEAVSTFGIPDLLVNNAGISHIGLLQDMTPEEWSQILQTNLSSVFYCCKTAIPYMLQEKQGKIVNISSVWGTAGASMEVAYSASKGGVNTMTKALAKELAPSNISVNAIACGIIDTEMNSFLSSEERQAILDEIPAGRMGNAKEVAQMVHSLSIAPAYLTGQIITLDGGWIS